jgi:hypothetical protein
MSRGRLHLTGASLIAAHLTDDNFEGLIAAALGKTKRQIEALLVTIAPKKPFEPSIRKQPASDPAPERGGDVPLLPQGLPDGGAPKAPPKNILQPATEDRFNVRFSAGRAFTEKLERLAEVLGIKCPRNHLEQILTRALDIALEKKDPQRKLERKRRQEARKESRTPVAQKKATVSPREEKTRPEARPHGFPSRHVPADVQARMFERAGYQCEYRGPDGARCTCRTGLQVEHVRPFAVYRAHEEEYLRVFCPAHNQYAARRYYGRAFMERKIEAARRKSRGERSVPGQGAVPESTDAPALPRGALGDPG